MRLAKTPLTHCNLLYSDSTDVIDPYIYQLDMDLTLNLDHKLEGTFMIVSDHVKSTTGVTRKSKTATYPFLVGEKLI